MRKHDHTRGGNGPIPGRGSLSTGNIAGEFPITSGILGPRGPPIPGAAAWKVGFPRPRSLLFY